MNNTLPNQSSVATSERTQVPRRGFHAAAKGSAWGREQIVNRLPVDFPDDESMRISPEAIYQALYVQGRGASGCELVASLHTGRALRVPRSHARQRASGHVTTDVMISQRPGEADDRAVPDRLASSIAEA